MGPREARAPRVLVLGSVLGQPMSGVRRHAEQVLPRAARALHAAGGALSVLEGAQALGFALPDCAQVVRTRVPAGPAWKRALAEGAAVRAELRRAARAGTPHELVHCGHMPPPRGLDLPLALLVHDLRALEWSGTPLARRLAARWALPRAVRRARVLIAVSESVAASLRARFALDEQRVRVAPHGCDHLPLLPRATGAACVLHVGHLEPRKNLELVLRALALDPALPPLWLAGAGKAGHERVLARRARELGLEARVRFLGPVSDEELARLLAQAGVLVQASHVEGFGIAVLEAQRAGVPVAIAELPALRETAGASAPGFAVDDPRACARALQRALASEPAELGRAAERARAASWENATHALLAAWEAAFRVPKG
jgi:glycosyltransferase involved in cell wall biosynthesis